MGDSSKLEDMPKRSGGEQTIQSLFEDQEAVAAEETRTITAPEVEDLEDLATLLEESTALAEARKGLKNGKKLSPLQQELLEAARLAAEAALWEDKAVYAHLAAVSCGCGNHFEDFRGYYTYQERKGGGRRLIAAPTRPEAASIFISEEVVHACHLCFTRGPLVAVDDNSFLFAVPPVVTVADCDLLGVLGKCYEVPSEGAADAQELEPLLAEEELAELQEFVPPQEELP